jgi:hypothetical protein
MCRLQSEAIQHRLLFVSYRNLLSFDALNLVPDLLTQPIQVIVNGRQGIDWQI